MPVCSLDILDNNMEGSLKVGYWHGSLRLFTIACAVAAIVTLLPTGIWQVLSQAAVTIWLAGGKIRQSAWNSILDKTGDDLVQLYVIGSVVITACTYWVVGSLYVTMDIFNRPLFLRKYKVQPGTHEPIDKKKLLQALLLVFFNQTVVSAAVAILLKPLVIWREFPDVRTLPSIQVAIFQLLVCIIFEELGFYYTHRIMHYKWLYKYFHKKHHEWTAPVALVAVYAHPVEHVISNIMPPFLGVFITSAHVSVTWTWFLFATIYTLNEHSGYHLPFLPSSEYHDFHHFKFTNNFGVLGLLDYLHGTDLAFKRNMAFQRHRTLYTLKSAREVYPDEKKSY